MIEISEISKQFGDHLVLDKVSFTVEKSESVVIIGRSGGGKSVLLKHMIGLLQPDSGHVKIGGQDISRLNERELLKVRQKFGMLFQGAALFDSMTVEENIGFVLNRERKYTTKEIELKVAEALELVDLTGIQKKKPAELSGGMRKRVGLARAIIYRPEIILYDEPTTGLDPIVADSIDQLILKVCEQIKTTTIAVTHDMRTAKRIGKRILMLHNKKIYKSGSPDDFFSSEDPIVSQFVKGISDSKEMD